MTDHYLFGGGSAVTELHPLVVLTLCAGIVALWFLPRTYLLIPFVTLCFLVPQGQTLVIAGFHLFAGRVAILAGCVRILATLVCRRRRPLLADGINSIDMAFLCWAVTRAFCFTVLNADLRAIANQAGFLLDSLGGYGFLRFAINGAEDTHRTIKLLAVLTSLVGLCMVYERHSMVNVFGFIGGQLSPAIREGIPRSQGPFSHAIPAGIFGATTWPLFIDLLLSKRNRCLAFAGAVGAMAMAVTSMSSTSLAATGAGVAGMCLWPLRRHMRTLRWSIAFSLVFLALAMKAPVWFLISRVDFVGGSSSYHRAMLIDQCIRHFDDWWLLGVTDNRDWGWDMWDVQNQFVTEALRGGLASLVFFLILIVRTFSRIGCARRAAEPNGRRERLMWILGVVMLAHIVAFFGADYFDQSKYWWYSTLALVSAATASPTRTSPVPGACVNDTFSVSA